ncbi:prevent-host-death family protein [Actinopolymorpha cephalotaxi]|uniref:Antitoxin n=1 Tax=Actinopolymorpha cephalotaxi TaxID=504797 RepID=A0A1I2LQE5_9ACTN|nr:type II toxin-antitoxin system Phd/YefM family antitoxin [Actinopolymorpha cephalotaxi]NYH81404.1 prevent-host-death family protein [Actinopolymorpha cephalotaxi]SFF81485.1 prevent-host-death family protein [Actinopolymorpha cephalotaxi]
MSTYTMTDATRRTAEMVNEARYGGEPVVITDHGKPAAIVISPEMMARYQALEDAADLAEIEAIKSKGPVWVSNEDAQRQMNQWLDEADAAGDQTR